MQIWLINLVEEMMMHLEQLFESMKSYRFHMEIHFLWSSFDETTLSILTAPNTVGDHVEIQVDDVIFVGHTLSLNNNPNLKTFAVFFVLRVYFRFLNNHLNNIFSFDFICRRMLKHPLNYLIKKWANVSAQQYVVKNNEHHI